MRLLITGGTGTLGAQIVKRYARNAESIHIIDNFATSSTESVSAVEEVKVWQGSIASKELVEEVFEACGPTHVIHLAASYKDPTDWSEDVDTNIHGMVNLVKASEKFGVSKFINIQTVLCYGRPEKLPIPISAPLRPESSYAITKVAAENFLMASELAYASLRLGTVISPGLSIGPIPNFYKNLIAGSPSKATRSIRDFLDIEDFLDALDKFLQKESPNGPFNISSGKGVSMPQIYEIVASALGKQPDLEVVDPQSDDIPEIVLDASETSRAIGWQARVPLTESIEKCIDYYKKTGVGEIYTHLKTNGDRR